MSVGEREEPCYNPDIRNLFLYKEKRRKIMSLSNHLKKATLRTALGYLEKNPGRKRAETYELGR